jgi:exopolysaccharide production protein ExoQ
MPPNLALFLTLGFIAFLFWRDFRERPDVSTALWLPCIWMFLTATRSVGKWLVVLGLPGFATTTVEEGSTLDAFVFLGLIAMAVYVLRKRQVTLVKLIRDNRWLTCFVLYCLLSVFWSDFAFVSFKRWIKILGHPIMVVLLFTETNREEALGTLVKRNAYVFLPLSICWMKYFPKLGRKASEFGVMSNCGLAETKNVLGGICWILAFFFLWRFLQVRKRGKGGRRRDELRLTIVLIAMAGYCLLKAHSAAADIALMLASATLLFLGLRFVNKRTIWAYAVTAIVIFGAAQLTFDLYGKIVDLSGHEATIEGRGRLWEILLATDLDPVLGAGFESYWLGGRVDKIWSMPEFWWHPNQAHNGYLELYLNLGIVGLCIFAGVTLSAFQKIRLDLLECFELGRFEMGCLVGILAHNWTEAGFKGLSFSFLIFFIISVRYRREPVLADASNPALVSEDEAELVYSNSAIHS